MTQDWKAAANPQGGVVRLAGLASYTIASSGPARAPIDEFYSHKNRLIGFATPALFATNKWVSGYLLTSVISATEFYFRSIFGEVICVCPVAQKLSSEKNIQVAAAIWHGERFFSRAAFEHLSFADADQIKKCSREFVGYEIKSSAGSCAAFDEFEKLCELRHGIVHAGLYMPGKNAVKLGLPKPASSLSIEFDLAQLHEAILVCERLVENYNLELFEKIASRWAVDWPRRYDWVAANEFMLFKKICDIFFSQTKIPPDRPSVMKLKNMVKKGFNLT